MASIFILKVEAEAIIVSNTAKIVAFFWGRLPVFDDYKNAIRVAANPSGCHLVV